MQRIAHLLALPETRAKAVAEIAAAFTAAPTVAAAAAALDVTERSIYRWRDAYPELRSALERAGLRNGGRPEPRRDRLAERAREGLARAAGAKTLVEAAARAGVSVDTIRRWRQIAASL